MRFFITTSLGLEITLAAELEALGAEVIESRSGGVLVEAPPDLVADFNLRLSTALRVLVPVAEGPCHKPKDLYRLVAAVAWERYLLSQGSLAVFCVGKGPPSLRHTGFAALKVKDAIVDRFRERTGERPSVDREDPDLCIRVYLEEDRATISLDASGDSLHRRGYRLKRSVASLRETLAAGILRGTIWDRTSPLIDLTCGAGTFLIEAALYAGGIPPGGRRRSSACWRWLEDGDETEPGGGNASPSPWSESAHKRRLAELPSDLENAPILLGYDRDPAIIAVARENAAAAGLSEHLRFEVRDLRATKELPDPGAAGVIVCNPPYGERLDDPDLEALYGSIGDVFKQQCSGYQGYIFTGNLALAKRVGLKTRSRRKLWNGPIECRVLEYELYRGTRKRRDADA